MTLVQTLVEVNGDTPDLLGFFEIMFIFNNKHNNVTKITTRSCKLKLGLESDLSSGGRSIE